MKVKIISSKTFKELKESKYIHGKARRFSTFTDSDDKIVTIITLAKGNHDGKILEVRLTLEELKALYLEAEESQKRKLGL